MAYKIRWLKQAYFDLSIEVGYVLGEYGLSVARGVEAEVYNGVRQLSDFPYMGVRYTEVPEELGHFRIFHLKKLSIVYRVDEGLISVAAVWNHHRDDRELSMLIGQRWRDYMQNNELHAK